MSLELNSCVLIDYRLWAAKSEGRQWVEHCIEQCIEHPPEPRSGLCPELLADFRIPKPPGCSQGAQRAVFCAVRVADFLAEGAGWGASPGRGGELGCQRAIFCAVRVADFLAQGAGWGAFPGRRGRAGVADSDGARSPSPLPGPSILIHFSSAAVCTLSSWRKLRRLNAGG